MASESDILDIPGSTLTDRASSAPAVRTLRLLDEQGHLVAAVERARFSLGQQSSNDLVLDDKTVSRFHCELLLDGGEARVRDLESRNGTWVDGTRVAMAFLRDGARLRVGRTTLVVKLGLEVQQAVSPRTELGALVGRSVAMRAAFELLEKAAPTDSTVLLDGETGTGKELAAEALHLLSPRREKPFVVVDCAGIPPNLLETELFGHHKGSFTGATQGRMGAFEEADGGTILLDEIGELPLELQPKLLRVLERKEIRRIGTNQMTRLDVRVIAATHRDLRAAVNRGTCRADLYFRLSVVRITLPPLRERLEDLPLLVERLLSRLGAPEPVIDALMKPDFLAGLALQSWPGNVRELRNFLERCVVFREALPVDARSPAPAPKPNETFAEARQRVLEQFEKTYLSELLARHDGKVAVAAQEASIGRTHLYRLLHRHGLLRVPAREVDDAEAGD
ncbi:MAG: sigma-54-dependent Fis family transcriptional regulator [Deltaproteobacteria bacterium]|nr:sigma-54-dependent Fis family transcriptional regulator [Deltaproteobacteria bacterium]